MLKTVLEIYRLLKAQSVAQRTYYITYYTFVEMNIHMELLSHTK